MPNITSEPMPDTASKYSAAGVCLATYGINSINKYSNNFYGEIDGFFSTKNFSQQRCIKYVRLLWLFPSVDS